MDLPSAKTKPNFQKAAQLIFHHFAHCLWMKQGKQMRGLFSVNRNWCWATEVLPTLNKLQ